MTPETAIREVLAAYERGEIRFDFPACPLVDIMRTVLAVPEEDKLAGAKSQGQAQFDSILEMVEAFRKANETRENANGDSSLEVDCEMAEQRIHEDALSVEVRSDWTGLQDWHLQTRKPAEYQILLCTGGPACRIVGQLNEHCEPETAVMQVQDWFQPWTDYRPEMSADTAGDDVEDSGELETAEAVMLAYARCFWFGE